MSVRNARAVKPIIVPLTPSKKKNPLLCEKKKDEGKGKKKEGKAVRTN